MAFSPLPPGSHCLGVRLLKGTLNGPPRCLLSFRLHKLIACGVDLDLDVDWGLIMIFNVYFEHRYTRASVLRDAPISCLFAFRVRRTGGKSRC